MNALRIGSRLPESADPAPRIRCPRARAGFETVDRVAWPDSSGQPVSSRINNL